jgi:hypothetical protein
MIKKISLLLAAVAAVAFAVPAVAGAHSVTSPPFKLAPVGSVMTATGNDITINSNILGAITCEKLTTEVALTKNNGVLWEAAGAAAVPPQMGCKNGGKAVVVTKLQVTRLLAEAAGTTMNFTATVDIGVAPNEVECTFTGVNVPFEYVAAEPDVIKFANAAGVAGVPVACGNAKLSGTFTLEIAGVGVTLD